MRCIEFESSRILHKNSVLRDLSPEELGSVFSPGDMPWSVLLEGAPATQEASIQLDALFQLKDR